ncbi:phosphatidylinositol glycan, class A, partial [Paragonimus westermani]
SFSGLGHETVLHAQILGIPTVVTDHSLFGFADLSSVLINKAVECVLTAVDHVICVSHTCKENTVLRYRLDAQRVYVIPNAIDSSMFTPDVTASDTNYVTVVVVSRLVYRKGIDLLVAIIPPLCAIFPQLRFLIGGDGPKLIDLEEVRERHQLHSRVKLLGALVPEQVRGVLVQGDIFLNTSLTEAFCIALIEAASCGFLIVITAVGGVPEVLPNEFIQLAPARASDLAKCVSRAIRVVLERRQSVNHTRTKSAVLPEPPLGYCDDRGCSPDDNAMDKSVTPTAVPCETAMQRAW